MFILTADSTVPKSGAKQSEVSSVSECAEIIQSTNNRNSARFSKIFDDASVDIKIDKEFEERKANKKSDPSLSADGACSQAALACANLPTSEEKEICLVLDNGIYSASYLNPGKTSTFATYSRLSQTEAPVAQHLPASASDPGDQIKKRKSTRQKGTELSANRGMYLYALFIISVSTINNVIIKYAAYNLL